MMTVPNLRETASALEIAWVVWGLGLLPFKANNLREAWRDWRAQMAIPRLERDPGQYVVAFGTWWMDVSIAVILVSFLTVGLAAIVSPPPVRQEVVRLTDYAGLLFLVANGGLTGVIMTQWWMRHEWRLYAATPAAVVVIAAAAAAQINRIEAALAENSDMTEQAGLDAAAGRAEATAATAASDAAHLQARTAAERIAVVGGALSDAQAQEHHDVVHIRETTDETKAVAQDTRALLQGTGPAAENTPPLPPEAETAHPNGAPLS